MEMEKNENGYPIAPTRVEKNGTMTGDRTVTPRCNPDTAEGAGCRGNACSGDGWLDSMEPAYVYAPSQKFCMLFSDDDALWHGTLFEQLYKPMEVYGRE